MGHSILKGRVVVETTDGHTLVPDFATVYLIYQGERSGTGNETAGRAYDAEQLNVAQAIAKDTTERKDQISKEPKEQRIDEFINYYLESVDQALKAAAEWAEANGKKWQFIVIMASDGNWSQTDLQPGRYKVVARGNLGNLDADWESSVTLAPGQTATVDLTHLKMGRKLSK